MKKNDSVSELTFLFKLLPVIREMETVDKIYRLLLAITTTGRAIGYRRAMLFTVDETNETICGRFGVSQPKDAVDSQASNFEDRARQVFTVYEGVEGSDLTVQAKSFTVPLAWHGSALVKTARTTYPVLAEREASEYASDPFFNFFDSNRYIAVPLKIHNRVVAVLAADGGVARKRRSVEDISLLYALAQQASVAAQTLVDTSETRRRSRIVRKLQMTLSEANTREKMDEGLRLALIMLSRAVGSSGCLIKDFTRQRTTHIKTVHEYSPDASDEDVAIAENFDTILDETAAKVEPITGDSQHALLSADVARTVTQFRATPLMAGDSVAGALAVYREVDGPQADEPFTADDSSFLDLCTWIIASKLEAAQLEDRNARSEDFVQEVTSNLARERERSRLAERSLDFHAQVTEDLKAIAEQVSSRRPYAKRVPKISEIVKDMQRSCREHVQELLGKKTHYELIDVFDVTRRTVQDCSSLLSESGIEVTIRIPANGPQLLMDHSQMALAIENIVRVTASCLARGDKMLVECSNSQDRVLLCFADNSIGLPGDAISRLIMPFSEAEKSDDKRRALSLAGEIIQKHSGEILIKSSMSWKTILILSFPKNANRDRRKHRRDRRRRDERRSAVHSRS